MARPHVERGALVPVLGDWPRAPQPVYLVYPPSRHLSAKLRVFVDWAAELFAGRQQLRGMRIVEAPEVLRHFTAKFAEI